MTDDEFGGECDWCHQTKQVFRAADPFLLEIHEEEVVRVWCDDCFRDRADEI